MNRLGRKIGLTMFGWRVFEGLGQSAFIADVDSRDREPLSIIGALAGGFLVGAVAALAAMALILALFTLATGHGSEGFPGISNLLIAVRDEKAASLSSTVLQLLLDTGLNGAFAMAYVALAAALLHRYFLSFVTAATNVRWRLLLVGLALGAAALAPVMIVDRLVSGGADPLPMIAVSPHWQERVGYVLIAALFIPAAAAEELLFRGWLLRLVAAFNRHPLVLIPITAVTFAVLHFDFNPDSLLTRTLMGAGFAYMTLRLGGIEFSTGAHAANNILIILFIQPLTLQLPEAGGGISAQSLLEDGALVAGYIVITELVVRVAVLRNWAGLKAGEISPLGDSPAAAVGGSDSGGGWT